MDTDVERSVEMRARGSQEEPEREVQKRVRFSESDEVYDVQVDAGIAESTEVMDGSAHGAAAPGHKRRGTSTTKEAKVWI